MDYALSISLAFLLNWYTQFLLIKNVAKSLLVPFFIFLLFLHSFCSLFFWIYTHKFLSLASIQGLCSGALLSAVFYLLRGSAVSLSAHLPSLLSADAGQRVSVSCFLSGTWYKSQVTLSEQVVFFKLPTSLLLATEAIFRTGKKLNRRVCQSTDL